VTAARLGIAATSSLDALHAAAGAGGAGTISPTLPDLLQFFDFYAHFVGCVDNDTYFSVKNGWILNYFVLCVM
jgi:hypothetical protein